MFNIYIILSIKFYCEVPYELLNKKFRAVQKELDREVSQVASISSELSQCSTRAADSTLGSVRGMLKSMEQRLTSMKRKAEESLEEELECTQLCKMRLDHLRSYVSGKAYFIYWDP